MADCTHNCASCSSACSSREQPQREYEKLNSLSKVKRVIAVVSGKGGVGKSFVTGLLASQAQRQGLNTAILDADLTGPSIPTAFGLHERIKVVHDNSLEAGGYMIPARSQSGIQVMSLNLLLDNETEPVLWRGAMIAGTVAQFWGEVFWDDVDIMFIDMPPGTGDVPITVLDALPLDGIVVVTSPQDMVSMIVTKAINMAKTMKVPVLGIVENMSCFYCPNCGEAHPVFGDSKLEQIATEHGINSLLRLPIAPGIAPRVDAGMIEHIQLPGVKEFTQQLI